MQSTSAPFDSAPTTDRVVVLDVLRGVALLGMYVVHFIAKTAVDQSGTAEGLRRVSEVLFEGRFYAMFGILFGAGFAMQLRRADIRGERFTARFLRRLAALAVFGLIADIIFGYAVLLGYAMWGVGLLLVRRWSTRRLVALFFVCAASTAIYQIVRGTYLTRHRNIADVVALDQAAAATVAARMERYQKERLSRRWTTVIGARLEYLRWSFANPYSNLPYEAFTYFLIGIIGLRLGVADRPERFRGAITILMLAGAASSALATWGLPIGTPRAPTESDNILFTVAVNHLRYGFGILREEWLAFVY